MSDVASSGVVGTIITPVVDTVVSVPVVGGVVSGIGLDDVVTGVPELSLHHQRGATGPAGHGRTVAAPNRRRGPLKITTP